MWVDREVSMLVGALIVVLFIFGLFLSMISSSPKVEDESHSDTLADTAR
jgi:hypothetical protein